MAKNVSLKFAIDRETKNTIRFNEVVDGDLDVAKVGSIYVSKPTLKELGWSRDKPLVVTISI